MKSKGNGLSITVIRTVLLILSTVVVLMIVCLLVLFWKGDLRFDRKSDNRMEGRVTVEELYQSAVRDAMTIESEELFPLLVIEKGSGQLHWNQRDKVLMGTFHQYPKSYIAGDAVRLRWGEVWSFSIAEIESWYQTHQQQGKKENDWKLRLEQLIGLPPNSGYTHFTAFWVDPADMIRPAYQTDITIGEPSAKFPRDENGKIVVDPKFKKWFDGNIVWSYFDSAYPWTRIGYTYDWGDSEREYGLSEFLVNADSTVDVEFTYTIEEFVDYLNDWSTR